MGVFQPGSGSYGFAREIDLKRADNSITSGALTHYSYALRDAIASVQIPTVEVHLSNINAREDFRKISVIKDKCISQISGLGKHVYTEAIKTLVNHL